MQTTNNADNDNVSSSQQSAVTFRADSLVEFIYSILAATTVETHPIINSNRNEDSPRRDVFIPSDAPQLSELLTGSVSESLGTCLPLQITNLSCFDRWWLLQISSLFSSLGPVFKVFCSANYAFLVGSSNSSWEPLVFVVMFQFKHLWPGFLGILVFGLWVFHLIRTQMSLEQSGILNPQTVLVLLPVALCIRTVVAAGVRFVYACGAPSYATRRISEFQLRMPVTADVRFVGIWSNTSNNNINNNAGSSSSTQSYLHYSLLKLCVDSLAFSVLYNIFVFALSLIFTMMSASDMTAWACGLILFKAFPFFLADRAELPTITPRSSNISNASGSQTVSVVEAANRTTESYCFELFWKCILPQLALIHLVDRFFVYAFFPNAFLVYSTLATTIEFLLTIREISALIK